MLVVCVTFRNGFIHAICCRVEEIGLALLLALTVPFSSFLPRKLGVPALPFMLMGSICVIGAIQ